MNDLPEAIGSAIEGGLIARTVEPDAGEARDGHTHEGACLNCGTPLAGPYCYHCGQRAHVHRTLGAFFHDFVHGVFHFEGKTWRTLPLLAWRPGRLTREYVEGRRASYVSPIALFLFATFLLFATIHAIGGTLALSTVSIDGKTENLDQGARTLGTKLGQLETRRKEAVAAHRPTASIDSDIADTRDALKTVQALRSGDINQIAAQVSGPPAAAGSGRLARAWQEIKSNPELVLYKLQTNAYKYSWLLIPISVPFVWLLFAWRRRYNLYDHTVFVTYSLSFMKLALTVGFLCSAAGLRPLAAVPVLYAPFHMFRQLRDAYELGFGGALVRTALLLVFAGIALVLWTVVLVAMVLGE